MKKIWKVLVLILCLFTLSVLTSCDAHEMPKPEGQIYFESAQEHINMYHADSSWTLYSYEGYEYNGEYFYVLCYSDGYNGVVRTYNVYYDEYRNIACSDYSCSYHTYSANEMYYEFSNYGVGLYLDVYSGPSYDEPTYEEDNGFSLDDLFSGFDFSFDLEDLFSGFDFSFDLEDIFEEMFEGLFSFIDELFGFI